METATIHPWPKVIYLKKLAKTNISNLYMEDTTLLVIKLFYTLFQSVFYTFMKLLHNKFSYKE
jgi:hypothetical protein